MVGYFRILVNMKNLWLLDRVISLIQIDSQGIILLSCSVDFPRKIGIRSPYFIIRLSASILFPDFAWIWVFMLLQNLIISMNDNLMDTVTKTESACTQISICKVQISTTTIIHHPHWSSPQCYNINNRIQINNINQIGK